MGQAAARNIDAVLAALRVHAPYNDEARKCLDYVTRNQNRMRYPQFQEQGIESASPQA